MNKQKTIEWEKISEGTITSNEINALETNHAPISLLLSNINSPTVGNITISSNPKKRKTYNLFSNLNGFTVREQPYKYLGFAVRKAVKEYKKALRTGQWRVVTK